MGRTVSRALLFAATSLLLTAHPLKAQGKAEATWVDGSGKPRSRVELERILAQHRLWRNSNEQSGRLADLSGANLDHVDFSDSDLVDLSFAQLNYAILEYAKLRDAYLHGAFLNHANLKGADLHNASLVFAQLNGAYLRSADLDEADVRWADLKDANLEDVDFRGTDLSAAILSGADLIGANLAGAILFEARLNDAIFEPRTLPEVREVATASDLELLTYGRNPDALVQLRKLFADGGFREQERKITHALKRRETELLWEGCRFRQTVRGWKGELVWWPGQLKPRPILWSSDSSVANCGSFVLNRAFFDWTCQYGMSPGRPLSLGVLVWFVCSVLYFVCIHVPGRTGLYRIYAQGTEEEPSAHRRVEEVVPREIEASGAKRFPEFLKREWSVLRASMFFSLMSAFNIGFRDINFGRWLRLLTREEFDIRAVGWARVVAGWQSLISVFLIALWVLTYFGRPFG